MIDTYLIEEIATKECERYGLEKNGFVTSRKAMSQALLAGKHVPIPAGDSPEAFRQWKERLLDDWYDGKGFSLFFRRKAAKRCMLDLVKRLYLNTVLRIRKNQSATTIDDELKLPSGRTVAFKLSSGLFSELYADLRSDESAFISPAKLEGKCVEQINSLYPLNYISFFKRLQKKDNEFWEELWLVIQYFLSYLMVNVKREKEAVEEVSMDVALSFQEQMERGSLEKIDSASHLLHSLRKTCRNKLFEHLREDEKRQSESLLGEEEWQWVERTITSLDEKGQGKTDGRFIYLLETDEKNEYAVSCALVDVLTFGKGAVYEKLVAGMEDKVQLLAMLYLEGKSYEEIAWQVYGKCDQSQMASLRKSASRAKEYLKKRMVDLIIGYKRKEYVPFVKDE